MLVDRLDRQHPPGSPPSGQKRGNNTEGVALSADRNVPPAFLIRDAANDAGVRSATQMDDYHGQHDVISKGLLTIPVARTLLTLYVQLPT